jgi:hypothetical protein
VHILDQFTNVAIICTLFPTEKADVMMGSKRRSRTLTPGRSKEMGRYEEPSFADFPGFRIGTITVAYHRAGKSALAAVKQVIQVTMALKKSYK